MCCSGVIFKGRPLIKSFYNLKTSKLVNFLPIVNSFLTKFFPEAFGFHKSWDIKSMSSFEIYDASEPKVLFSSYWLSLTLIGEPRLLFYQCYCCMLTRCHISMCSVIWNVPGQLRLIFGAQNFGFGHSQYNYLSNKSSILNHCEIIFYSISNLFDENLDVILIYLL